MAIRWTPSNSSQIEVGQLGIRVRAIRFVPSRVPDHALKNPRMEVVTYDDEWNEHTIERWSPPRSLIDRQGPYGGIINFGETMKSSSSRKDLTNFRNCKDMGFDATSGEWRWNKLWGNQYSTENVHFRGDRCVMPQRPNAIDLRGVRLIVQGILARGLHHVTNRQAILLADAAFGRAHAVPGILDAVLVSGDKIDEFP